MIGKGDKKCGRGIVTYYAKIGLSKRSRRDAKLQSSRFFERFCRDGNKHSIIFDSGAINTILHLLETEQNDAPICRNCVTCVLYLSRNSEIAKNLVNYFEVFLLLSKFVNHFDLLLQERCIRSIGYLGSHKSTVQRLVAEGLLLPLIQLLDRATNVRVKVAVLDCLSMLYLSHKICVRMMTIWFFPSFRRISDLMFNKLKNETSRLRVVLQFGKLLHNFCQNKQMAESLLVEGGFTNFRDMCGMFDFPVGKKERYNSMRRKIRKISCETFVLLSSFKNNDEIHKHFLNPIISHKEMERMKLMEKERKKKLLAEKNKALSEGTEVKKKNAPPRRRKRLFKRKLIFKKRGESAEEKESKLAKIMRFRKGGKETKREPPIKKDVCFLFFAVKEFFHKETIFEHRVMMCKGFNNFIINNQDSNRRGQLRKFIFMSTTIKNFDIILKCSGNSRDFQKMILEVFVQKLKRWKNLDDFPKSLIKNLVAIWKRTYDSDLKLLSAESLAAFSNQGAFRQYLAENSNLSSIITHLKNKSIRNRIWAARVLSNLCSSASNLHILNRLTEVELVDLTQTCFEHLSEFYTKRFDLEYLMYLVKICAYLMCMNKGDSESLTKAKHTIRERFLHDFDSVPGIFSIFEYIFEMNKKRLDGEEEETSNPSGGGGGFVRRRAIHTSSRGNTSKRRTNTRRKSATIHKSRRKSELISGGSRNIYKLPPVDLPVSRTFQMTSTMEKIVILLFRILKELLYFANRHGTGNYAVVQICLTQRRILTLLMFTVYRRNQKVCSIAYELFLEFLAHPSNPYPNFWRMVVDHTLDNIKNSPPFPLLQSLLTFLKSLVFQGDVSLEKKLIHRIEIQVFDVYVAARPISNSKLICGKILVKLHGSRKYREEFQRGDEFLNDLKTFVRDFHLKKKRSFAGAARGRNKLRRVLFSQNVGGGLMSLSKRKHLDGSSGGGIVSKLVKGKLNDIQRGREERKEKEMTDFLRNTKTEGHRSKMISKKKEISEKTDVNEDDWKLLNVWRKDYGFVDPIESRELVYTPRGSVGFVMDQEPASFFRNREKLTSSKELARNFSSIKKYNFNDEVKHFERIDDTLLGGVEFSIKEKNMVKERLGLMKNRASRDFSRRYSSSSSSVSSSMHSSSTTSLNQMKSRKNRKRRRRKSRLSLDGNPSSLRLQQSKM